MMNKYDVVLVDFPHQENDGIRELHPAVILDDSHMLDLAALVTSKVQKYEGRPYCYTLLDWEKAGLDKPSLVKLNRVEKFELDDILALFGHLTNRDIEGIERMLGESLKNSSNKLTLDEDLFLDPTSGIAIITDEDCTDKCANDVIASYQNANKWLDIIKEFLYKDLGCVFFSSYIHNLAHTMPQRFDKFGDILHTADIKVPYPETKYIPKEPKSIDDCFELVFAILDDIKAKLNAFISCTDEINHGLACSAEALLNDIEGEYVPLNRMKQAWEASDGDQVAFDKWVCDYVGNKDKLAESLKKSKKK